MVLEEDRPSQKSGDNKSVGVKQRGMHSPSALPALLKERAALFDAPTDAFLHARTVRYPQRENAFFDVTSGNNL